MTNDIHGTLTCDQAFFLSRREKESLKGSRSLARFSSKALFYELSHLEIRRRRTHS